MSFQDFADLFKIETTTSIDATGTKGKLLDKDPIYETIVKNARKRNDQ